MPIKTEWDKHLNRWTEAALIDTATADRIRIFEADRKKSSEWLVRVALALGAIMLGAGVLLFVAAHWDDLSPTNRFLLVLALVSVFHLTGAFLVEKYRNLGITLHALGTVSLGAGIFLAGQIFNLEEHWPGGVMLWALGASLAWLVRKDSVQAVFAALLLPAWLAGEWTVRTEYYGGSIKLLGQGLLALAFAYLAMGRTGEENHIRRALRVLGFIGVIPFAFVVTEASESPWRTRMGDLGQWHLAVFAVVGFVGPILLTWLFTRRETLAVAISVLWTWILGAFEVGRYYNRNVFAEIATYGWCAVGAVLLVVWGMRESDKARVNLGVLGFAVTVMAFYFSSVMDKLGRSVALMGFGVIFLIGGYELEKVRRKLMMKMKGGQA